ncbi:MAG: hypothetical protein CVU97_00715 [Firmicutes bacterium HGW-Firmicutes-21]|nr:MAG: hypothetical protein CVU97_00715 [Firmicutes bacterium HGW-Firmicutes-21]
MESNHEECYYEWNDFCDNIIYKNRYFQRHPILDKILKFAEDHTGLISDTVFYRARKYDESYCNKGKTMYEYALEYLSENDNEKNKPLNNTKKSECKKKFRGFPKGENLAPPKNILTIGGRANAEFISYLYLADSIKTAISEIKESIKTKVSVAEIICNGTKKIADFTYNVIPLGNDDCKRDVFWYYIMTGFSSVDNHDTRDYIPIQCISEFLKINGYDGIKYNSAYNDIGRNYVFFNQKDFVDISSEIYEIDSIDVRYKKIIDL